MHSVCVLSQLLVSVLFITVPTDTLVYVLFSSYAIIYSYTCTIKYTCCFYFYRQDNTMAMI